MLWPFGITGMWHWCIFTIKQVVHGSTIVLQWCMGSGARRGRGGTAGGDNRHFSILFWHSLFTLSVSIVSESFSSSNVKQLPILSFPKAGRTIAHCLIWIKRVVKNPLTFDNRHFSNLFWHSLFTLSDSIVNESLSNLN